VKSGERFSDEQSAILFDQASQSFRCLGRDALKLLFGQQSEVSSEAPKASASKATFKIEINDDEKVLRDKQQTTVYHTGLIEIDEVDRKEMAALEDVDEEPDEEEDDPDEDLNF